MTPLSALDAGAHYLDPSVLELEKERGSSAATGRSSPGSMSSSASATSLPVTVVDEPVVITPAALDGELRAFYNVCRPSAGQVALTKGNRKCCSAYHGWDLRTDGCLRARPRWRRPRGSRGRLRADDRPRRHGGVRVRGCSRTPRAAGRDDGRDYLRGGPAGSTSSPCARRAARLRRRVQLEGLRRQLPRGLPPADSTHRSSSRSSTTTPTVSRSSAITKKASAAIRG